MAETYTSAGLEAKLRSVTLTKQLAITQEFRKRYPTISASAIAAFLYIADETYLSNGCVRVTDIGAALDLTSASVSRNLAVLFDPHKGGSLLEYYENPERRNEKFMYLSKAGKRFADKLMRI